MYLIQGIKEKTGTRKMFQEGKSMLMSVFNYAIRHLIRYFEFLLRLNFHSWKYLFLEKLSLCLTPKLFPCLVVLISISKSIYWCSNKIKVKELWARFLIDHIFKWEWTETSCKKKHLNPLICVFYNWGLERSLLGTMCI